MPSTPKAQPSPFALPSELPRSGLKVADIEGALVVIRPADEEVTLDTTLGESTARPAEVLVVDGPGDPLLNSGWQPILLFGAALKAQAGAAMRAGRPLVGIIGKGDAKPGRNAPWVLNDPTPEQVEKARVAFLKVEVPF